MDMNSPAGQVKLSLMVIIVLSFCGGGFAILTFEGLLRGGVTYQPMMQAVVAVLFLGVSLLHARKITGSVR
jgi:hypothetical protein